MVGRSLWRSDTIVSPSKTAEPIEMPFGMWTRVRLGNHTLDAGAQWRNSEYE